MSTTDEREILRLKPSWWAVLLIPGRSIALAAIATGLAAVGAHWLESHPRQSDPFTLATGTHTRVAILGAALILARLAWECVARACRTYTLTTRRFVAVGGVLHRASVEVPLERVQNQIVDKTLAQRLVGVGSVAISTAASLTPDGVWHIIPRPDTAAEALRDAIAAARSSSPPPSPAPSEVVVPPPRADHPEPHPRPPVPRRPRTNRAGPLVLGLAGGIGSGKSEVARILASRGCVVSDSDREAKTLLDRPDIQRTLVSWWGSDVLTPQGKVDRKRLADIVFTDPARRARLEALIHPLLKHARAELLARAGPDTPAVVIDAPLLFEAGLEAECDAVLWVDSPREARLERVLRSRAWSEEELTRREKAQLPLEEKRRRADEIIVNDADLQTLESRVLAALDRILRAPRRSAP